MNMRAATGPTLLQQLVGAHSYQSPANGFSITIPDNTSSLVLDPAGLLTTGTITMPANPVDGQTMAIASSFGILGLTIQGNTGQTVKNAPTSLSITLTGTQGYRFVFRQQNMTWYRLQ